MPFDALYTPQTLGAVIQRTPDLPSFLKDKFFSNMKTFHTASIAFDVKKGRRTITPFVTPLAAAPVAGRTGYKTMTYTPAIGKKGKKPYYKVWILILASPVNSRLILR